MSVSLIVIIPHVLIALVGMLRFVGCVFPTGGLPFSAALGTTTINTHFANGAGG